MAQLLSVLRFNPDTFPNKLITSIVSTNDRSSPSKNTSVSSAYWEILFYFNPICIPLIFLFSLIIIAKISTHITNK